MIDLQRIFVLSFCGLAVVEWQAVCFPMCGWVSFNQWMPSKNTVQSCWFRVGNSVESCPPSATPKSNVGKSQDHVVETCLAFLCYAPASSLEVLPARLRLVA